MAKIEKVRTGEFHSGYGCVIMALAAAMFGFIVWWGWYSLTTMDREIAAVSLDQPVVLPAITPVADLEKRGSDFVDWVHGGRQPDLTLWFDIDPQLAGQRRAAAREPDRFEQQDAAFYTRVREGYRRRREAAPQRFVTIDATPTRDAVWQQIATTLSQQTWW